MTEQVFQGPVIQGPATRTRACFKDYEHMQRTFTPGDTLRVAGTAGGVAVAARDGRAVGSPRRLSSKVPAMTTARSYRREWIGFSTMSVGLFMAILDIQVVSAALPRMSRALNSPLDELSWVQTAYLITEVIAIAASGRFARAMSTRWLFTLASAAFALTSLGCALSQDFHQLIFWRALQGFAAGTIIPTVFAAGYKMFPKPLHPRAVLIAGVVAMIAPSIGPYIGGYIAETIAWQWIFLVNIPIGLAVALVVMRLVRVDEAEPATWRTLDWIGFAAISVCLTALQTTLKVGPEDGWTAPRDIALIILTLATGAAFVRRCLKRGEPLVDLAPLRHLGFSVACGYNFVLGIALFGSLYTLPLFLGFVRFHNPLQIGIIMTVMGASQLVFAPLASALDRRMPANRLAFIGFALFGAGALANAFETPRTDFWQLFVPQLLRGAALIFCILPITNVALDELPPEELSNASGVLNFCRNIGGAIGIGVVDTIIRLRPPGISDSLMSRILAGDHAATAFAGLPFDLFAGGDSTTADPADITFASTIVDRAAATQAYNEAWIFIGCTLLASLVFIPLLRRRGVAAPDDPVRGAGRLARDVPSALT